MKPGLPWFKLFTDIRTHRKTRRLNALLGEDASHNYVINILLTVAESFPSGVFEGRGIGDLLEREAGWKGRRGVLLKTLVEVGFLDVRGQQLVVHDWEKEQGAHVREMVRGRAKPDGRISKRLKAIPAGILRGDDGDSAGSSGGFLGADKRLEKEDLRHTLSGRGVGDDAPRQKASKKLPAKKPPTAAEAFVAWTQAARLAAHPGAVREDKLNAKQAKALLDALSEHGREALERGYAAFLGNEYAQKLDIPCPLPLFVAQTGRWVGVGAGQQEIPIAPAPLPPMPNTPAGAVWLSVLEVFQAQGRGYALEQLSHVRPVGLEGEELVLAARDKHAAAWLADAYSAAIAAELVELDAPAVRARFVAAGPQSATERA